MPLFGPVSFAAVVAAGLGGNASADPPHAAHFAHCARVCADCLVVCDTCQKHCLDLLGQGKKEHARSAQMCGDCRELYQVASALSARHSPLAGYACEACAKTCDDCAAECDKFKDQKMMADCAAKCRERAKACRDMVGHAGHGEK
ncbi:MAG: four-helix bundle copper-binding protein [Gemmataceae bacterium]|nr:four-helix bundle copper-binding protein [Gemmataceae bacterium]